MNVAILKGYLGKDPETVTTPKGVVTTRFSIAVNEKWTDQATGEVKERTDWFYISTFGKLAEVCGKHLAKGREVTVEGKFRVDEKEGTDGTKTRWHSIVASKVHFAARPRSDSKHSDDHDEILSPMNNEEPPF
jgi:single-strand DNA-binding protein